ncbi:MAG: hypothetical protein IPJ07_02485 [Acidobacteria bacterium]|nr:hypothetical protein [Acidobacteriota bacterium]
MSTYTTEVTTETGSDKSFVNQTPLAAFVKVRLAELEIRQSVFCRRNTFDQGLLSKIQNSQVNSLTIESVLKLAVGLGVPPQHLFKLIDRLDLHDLVLQTYAREFSEVLVTHLEAESHELAQEAQKALSTAFPEVDPPSIRIRRKRTPASATYQKNGDSLLKVGI